MIDEELIDEELIDEEFIDPGGNPAAKQFAAAIIQPARTTALLISLMLFLFLAACGPLKNAQPF